MFIVGSFHSQCRIWLNWDFSITLAPHGPLAYCIIIALAKSYHIADFTIARTTYQIWFGIDLHWAIKLGHIKFRSKNNNKKKEWEKPSTEIRSWIGKAIAYIRVPTPPCWWWQHGCVPHLCYRVHPLYRFLCSADQRPTRRTDVPNCWALALSIPLVNPFQCSSHWWLRIPSPVAGARLPQAVQVCGTVP